LGNRTIGLEPLKRLLADEDGAQIVEYALIAVLIVVVCVTGIAVIGRVSSQSLSTAAASI